MNSLGIFKRLLGSSTDRPFLNLAFLILSTGTALDDRHLAEIMFRAEVVIHESTDFLRTRRSLVQYHWRFCEEERGKYHFPYEKVLLFLGHLHVETVGESLFVELLQTQNAPKYLRLLAVLELEFFHSCTLHNNLLSSDKLSFKFWLPIFHEHFNDFR